MKKKECFGFSNEMIEKSHRTSLYWCSHTKSVDVNVCFCFVGAWKTSKFSLMNIIDSLFRFWNAGIECHVLWLWFANDQHKCRKIHFTDSYVSNEIFRISKYLWQKYKKPKKKYIYTRGTRLLRIQFFYTFETKTWKLWHEKGVRQQQLLQQLNDLHLPPYTYTHTHKQTKKNLLY